MPSPNSIAWMERLSTSRSTSRAEASCVAPYPGTRPTCSVSQPPVLAASTFTLACDNLSRARQTACMEPDHARSALRDHHLPVHRHRGQHRAGGSDRGAGSCQQGHSGAGGLNLLPMEVGENTGADESRHLQAAVIATASSAVTRSTIGSTCPAYR